MQHTEDKYIEQFFIQSNIFLFLFVSQHVSTNSLSSVSFSNLFTSLALYSLSLSSQPASGLDKQETLSVISRLFVCLNECQAKDREGNPTVHTLIPL